MPRHASRDGGDIQANSVRDLVGWNEDCAGNTQDHTNPRTIHTLDPPSLVCRTSSHLSDTERRGLVPPSGRYAGRARRNAGTAHRGRALRHSTRHARRYRCERCSPLSHQHSGTFPLPSYCPRERYFLGDHAPHTPILLLLEDGQPPTDNRPRHLPRRES
jgi:hypothetical protein